MTGHRHATAAHGLVMLFDPEVLDSADPRVRREGCLSVPDLTADVARPLRLRVRGTTIEGERVELEPEGFEARAILHEMDHLDGLLILDRVTSADGLFARKVYR